MALAPKKMTTMMKGLLPPNDTVDRYCNLNIHVLLSEEEKKYHIIYFIFSRLVGVESFPNPSPSAPFFASSRF